MICRVPGLSLFLILMMEMCLGEIETRCSHSAGRQGVACRGANVGVGSGCLEGSLQKETENKKKGPHSGLVPGSPKLSMPF